VIGGTNEGSLHLWDLRENSSLHKDRYDLICAVLYCAEFENIVQTCYY